MGQYVRGVFLFTPVFKETLCFSLLETTLVFDNVIKPDAHQCLQFTPLTVSQTVVGSTSLSLFKLLQSRVSFFISCTIVFFVQNSNV